MVISGISNSMTILLQGDKKSSLPKVNIYIGTITFLMERSWVTDDSADVRDLIGATAVALVTILTVMIALLVAQQLIGMVDGMNDDLGLDESSPLYTPIFHSRFTQAVDWWYVLAVVSCSVALIYIPAVVLRRQRYNDERRFRY